MVDRGRIVYISRLLVVDQMNVRKDKNSNLINTRTKEGLLVDL